MKLKIETTAHGCVGMAHIVGGCKGIFYKGVKKESSST